MASIDRTLRLIGAKFSSAMALVLAATLLAFLPTAIAHAEAPAATGGVKVEFSDDVNQTLRQSPGTPDPAQTRSDYERDFNAGLRELGKTNADAKALYDSGQTIRFVCKGSAEARAARLRPNTIAPAETRGDFDADGKPKAGGKAIVAIECDLLKNVGLNQAYAADGAKFFDVVVHELLHAANRTHTHGNDDLDIYTNWVTNFKKALDDSKRPPPAPPSSGKISYEPPEGAVQYTLAASYINRDLPNNKFGVLEFGGSIERNGLFNFDTREDGFKIGGSISYEFKQPVFGLSNVGIEVYGYYSRVTGTGKSSSISLGGGDNIFLTEPNGGLNFGAGTNFDNPRLRTNFQAYDFGVKLEQENHVGSTEVNPFIGLWAGHVSNDNRFIVDISGFGDFTDRRDADTWYVGVSIGVELKQPIGGNFYAFGYGSIDARVNFANVKWQVEGGGGGSSRSVNETQVTVGSAFWAGFGYSQGNFEAKTWIGVDLSNHFPTLGVDRTQNDGGDINVDWKLNWGWNIGASVAYKF